MIKKKTWTEKENQTNQPKSEQGIMLESDTWYLKQLGFVISGKRAVRFRNFVHLQWFSSLKLDCIDAETLISLSVQE